MYINSISQIEINSCIYIYGSGETGTDLFRKIVKDRKDINIKGFVDSYHSGAIDNKSIQKFDDFLLCYKDEIIIIASCFWPEIERILTSNGIKKYLTISNGLLYDLSPLNIFGDFYFNSKEESRYLKNILTVVNLFSNLNDKMLYLSLFGLRMNEQFDNEVSAIYFKEFNSKQLSDFDFLNLDSIKNAIDAGVFNGKETLNLLNKIQPNGHLFGFEPFLDLLSKDSKEFLELITNSNVSVFPYALWNKNENLDFSYSSDNKSGSTINVEKNGSTSSFLCKAVCLDSFLKDYQSTKIDLIRLDIEGSELNALYGAKNTIINDRPQLAISIYHKRDHLYEIPLYLNSILVNYHYTLGHFSSTFIDTVFYAIPNEIND